MKRSQNRHRITFRENVIHVGAGFVAKERPHVVAALSTLGPHLGRWDPSDVDIDVSLQDRGGREQRITLRTSLPGRPQLVAVADNPDLTRALCDAKRELIRQLEHQKSAREPMNDRRLGTRRFGIRARPYRPRSPNSQCRHTDTRHFEHPPAARFCGQRETVMTHITEARVIGNHAAMGGSTAAAPDTPLTVKNILRAGARRAARRREILAGQSTWDSEGGATGQGESLPNGGEGPAPRDFGR